MNEPERKSISFKIDIGLAISVLGFCVTIGFIVFNSGKRDAQIDYLSETAAANKSALSRVESKVDSVQRHVERLDVWTHGMAAKRDQQLLDIYRRLDIEESETRAKRDRSSVEKPKEWPKDWNDMERIRQTKTPGPQP